MLEARSAEQRRALGDFLRARREKLEPAALDLPRGPRRRTPGLRREEAAQICGLSTTWYTWIEQGRDVSVSPMALARLAVGLRLGRAERAYLFELAHKRDPDQAAAEADDMPPAVLACLATIGSPAYVLDRNWTARAWNTQAQRLFVGWLDQPGERNLLRFIFLEPVARSLIRNWEERARRVAAEFRAARGAHLDDPPVRRLIAELRQQSPAFAQFWDQHGILGREGGERTFQHPADGFLRYEQVTFSLVSQPALKLTVLVRGPPLPGCPDGMLQSRDTTGG